MLRLSDLSGLWRRSLIEWPDGRRDTTSKVQWLQGVAAFGDLRQPAHWPDFSHARGLIDFSPRDCATLAEQQAFAGYLTVAGDYCEWTRLIDFQPKTAHPDAGSLRWEQSVLIEEGRDVPYIEHWHRDAMVGSTMPIAGAMLHHATLDTAAVILRVGEHLMFARDRSIALPPRSTLSECIAEAESIEHAHAMLDCEISFAKLDRDAFRIYASTLPFRVGQALRSTMEKEWRVKSCEGDRAIFSV